MIEDVAAYQPWPSFAAHCAAKAAQAMLTRVFARALAPEVRVCGSREPIAVGPIRSSAWRPRRSWDASALPTRSPEAVVFLANADFVTGTTLVVDGGFLLQSGRAAPVDPEAMTATAAALPLAPETPPFSA